MGDTVKVEDPIIVNDSPILTRITTLETYMKYRLNRNILLERNVYSLDTDFHKE